jgi:hypothetical protein
MVNAPRDAVNGHRSQGASARYPAGESNGDVCKREFAGRLSRQRRLVRQNAFTADARGVEYHVAEVLFS